MSATVMFTEQEAVRLVGLRMLANGYSTGEVAEATQAGESTVRQWRARLQKAGNEPDAAARDAPRSGAPSKLTDEQRARLVRLLEAGPEAAGFDGQLWTLPRVREVIRQQFEVEYHVDHVGKLLAQLGFSPQRPARRPHERNEAAVRAFQKQTWPRLVKKGGF
jgi:transposase